MISCTAGLSRLHVWRFALAMLAGIIPARFLLADFGGEAVSGDPATSAGEKEILAALAQAGFPAELLQAAGGSIVRRDRAASPPVPIADWPTVRSSGRGGRGFPPASSS